MKIISMIFKISPLLLAALILAGTAGMGQTFTETKKIIRSFPANPDTRLDVNNKYGKIHVMPWKKDSVMVEIDLYISSNSSAKLDKIKDDIDFEFTGTKYYIIASTRFGTQYNNFFTDLKDLSGTIIPSKNQVEINYTVRVPSNLTINITHKYGDVYIDDLKGSVTVSLSNGDLKINRLEGDVTINHNFGNGVINYLGNGNLNLSYSDFEIKEAGQVSIDSRSSKVRINKIDILKTQSRRDRFVIGTANNLFGDSYFSDVWIYRLNEEMNYIPKYGDVKIDSIGAGFSYINLDSDYADLSLVFNKNSAYFLDIHFHPDVMLRLPEQYTGLQEVKESKEEIWLSGNIGKMESSKRVRISAPNKCTISIETR